MTRDFRFGSFDPLIDTRFYDSSGFINWPSIPVSSTSNLPQGDCNPVGPIVREVIIRDVDDNIIGTFTYTIDGGLLCGFVIEDEDYVMGAVPNSNISYTSYFYSETQFVP